MPLLAKQLTLNISPLTWIHLSGMQAKEVAAESAAAEARAAAAALRAVEAGIALYAEKRDYLKLKDIAEASDVAGKVRAIAHSFSFAHCRPRITVHSDLGIHCFLSQSLFANAGLPGILPSLPHLFAGCQQAPMDLS